MNHHGSHNTSYENLTNSQVMNAGCVAEAGLTAKTIARFWSHVQRGEGCWVWTASTLPKGYGQFNIGRAAGGRQQNRTAHRIAYALTYGPIPRGLHVMHRCDTPRCCNPTHLMLGTPADNLRDASIKGRLSGPKPRAWILPSPLREQVITECLLGPRGTVARLAREHNVNLRMLSQAVMRARRRQQGAA